VYQATYPESGFFAETYEAAADLLAYESYLLDPEIVN
jgi:hypothetical protein